MSAPTAPDEIVAWAELVTIGTQALTQIDAGRFVIGDCALLVDSHYGKDEIGRFADDINIEKKRAMEYRTVSRYYPPQIRAQFEGLPITYSHYKAAMRYDDLEQSIDILHQAAGSLWRVMDMVNAIKEQLGEPITPSPLVATLIFRQENGRIIVEGAEHLPMGVRLDAKLTEGSER